MGRYLALTVCLLQFSAGCGYLVARDLRHAIYWLAACIVNLTVL